MRVFKILGSKGGLQLRDRWGYRTGEAERLDKVGEFPAFGLDTGEVCAYQEPIVTVANGKTVPLSYFNYEEVPTSPDFGEY